MEKKKEMKKITLALLFLFGLIALTGCWPDDDDDDDDVELGNTIFSDIAGTYSGNITNGNDCNNDSTTGNSMTIVIDPSTGTTTTMKINGQSTEAHNLTDTNFQYTGKSPVNGCGTAAKFSGSCQHNNGSSLNCNYAVSGTNATGNMQLNR